MKKYFLFAGILASVSFGCEKAIDVNVPFEEPKLVLNGFLDPDSSLGVHLSKSQFVLDNAPLQNITDAKVTVSVGEELLGELPHQENGYYKLEGIKPEAGKIYTIRAEKTGLPAVEASEKVPAISVVKNIVLDSLGVGEYGQQRLSISFSLEDPPGPGDYYQVIVYETGFRKYYEYQPYNPDEPNKEPKYTWTPYQHPQQIESADPLAEEMCTGYYSSCGLLIKDEQIDGKLSSHKIIVESFSRNHTEYEKDVELSLKVVHVPASFYLYYKTLATNREASGNPFAEPAKAYSNVNGGFGIWSAIAPFTFKVSK